MIWLLGSGGVYGQANASPAFDYDGRSTSTMSYDWALNLPAAYDGASVLLESKKLGYSESLCILFGQFPKFLAAETTAQEGTQLYRVFGNEAQGLGNYYTTVNPGTVANFRTTAGLFPGNFGSFVLEGTLNNIGNLGTYAANPIIYEIGSKTLPTTVYDDLGLEGMSQIDKGAIITDQLYGGSTAAAFFTPVATTAYGTTVSTGLTPGAAYLLNWATQGVNVGANNAINSSIGK